MYDRDFPFEFSKLSMQVFIDNNKISAQDFLQWKITIKLTEVYS